MENYSLFSLAASWGSFSDIFYLSRCKGDYGEKIILIKLIKFYDLISIIFKRELLVFIYRIRPSILSEMKF